MSEAEKTESMVRYIAELEDANINACKIMASQDDKIKQLQAKNKRLEKKNERLADTTEIEQKRVEQLQAELKTERGNLAWALATLAVAICPHCDGSGVVTNMCGDTPEPEQCQWCHDRARLQALKEKQDG